MDRFASFDGAGIAYLTAGEGPDVLLLHGFAADHRVNWVAPGVVDALVAAGRRVIALDARGHGESDKPHDPDAYEDDAMARDARALLDHLGVDRVDVVGYSMGSLVSTRLVPDEARVRSCVLGGIGGKSRAARGFSDGAAGAARRRARDRRCGRDHRRLGPSLPHLRRFHRRRPARARPRSSGRPRPSRRRGSRRSTCPRW